MIIHNAEFDIAHLNNELSLLGKNKLKNEIVDTLVLARNKFPGSQVNLDALCKRYKIDNSKRAKHTALIDCELLSKVYINLIDQKEPTLDFQSGQYAYYDIDSTGVSYFKKVIVPNKSELDLHKKYSYKLAKSIFFSNLTPG